MANWNYAPILQALGWATLNSIWQMALLWFCFLVVYSSVKLSGSKRYLLAVFCVSVGFVWFVYTFCGFYFYAPEQMLGAAFWFPPSADVLPLLLSSASITYLCLLLIPIFRLVHNCMFIQKIKSGGLRRVSYHNRLFVEKIGRHVGIKKRVPVYLSQLVSSPVTIGFFKPVILLPISIVSNLSVRQVEAILLHELAHIRRHDYLVNLLLTAVHVLLYFNPFVKCFLKKIELERENCCDELVLQFGYDKIGYASALLELEKASHKISLAMGAASKNHLLQRIETIVGVKRKQAFKRVQFAGVCAGLGMLILLNMVSLKQQKLPDAFPLNDLTQASSFFVDEQVTGGSQPEMQGYASRSKKPVLSTTVDANKLPILLPDSLFPSYQPTDNKDFMYTHLAEDNIDLTTDRKEEVKKTVENTKKVLEIQWVEVDKAIGDAMTKKEKRIAQQDYLNEINQIDWLSVEENLNVGYDKIDWHRVNGNVADIMATAKLDSLEACYKTALRELNKGKSCSTPQLLPIPDVSVEQVQKAKVALKCNITEIEKLKLKKIVRL
jgi:beta-lactamase regulating signal transducer with metallopeptidase domain